MRTALAALSLTLALTLQAKAQSNEDERRQACTGDAFRFCAGDIPDRQKIRACLTANRDQISPECRSVIDGRRPAGRG